MTNTLPTWRVNFAPAHFGGVGNHTEVPAPSADAALEIVRIDAEGRWCGMEVDGQPVLMSKSTHRASFLDPSGTNDFLTEQGVKTADGRKYFYSTRLDHVMLSSDLPADVMISAIEHDDLGSSPECVICQQHPTDNAMLHARLDALNAEMAENPEMGRALVVIDEIAEICNALQRDGDDGRADDIADARREARFGVGL